MFRKIGFALGSLAIVGLAGVATAGPKGADGLVRGSVVTGPVCPGPERLGQRCAPRPAQATVKVFDAGRAGSDDKPVAVVVTDRGGRFRVTLAPGVYRFVPESKGGTSDGKPREVNVTAGSTTDVRLIVDTGMR